MAIILNDNLQINAGKPVDSKYLASTNIPYASVGAANAAIVQSYRYQGLKVNVNNIEYWYYTGTTDGDLVPLETPASVSGLTASLNGLTDDGVTVCLGGSLNQATTINVNSQSLSFSTNPVKYAGDYSGQFDALSIPDVGYTTGLTSGLQTQITANDNDISYLSGQTDLKLNITDFNVYSAATASDISQNASDIQLVSGVTTTNASNISTNAGNIAINTADITFLGVFSGDTVNDLAYISGATTANTANIAINAGNIADNAADITYISGITNINTADITYLSGQTDLKLNITDFNVYSGVTDTRITGNDNDIAYITGNTINTASNGLTKSGTDVKLGGTLTESTSINGAYGSYSLCLGTGNPLGSLCAETTGDIFIQHCAGSSALLSINASNTVLGGYNAKCIDITNTCMFVCDSSNSKGLEYPADYSGNFTPYSLVDKNYVDAASCVTGANNGLTLDANKTIVLGGTLTGDTTVDLGSYGLVIGSGGTATGADSITLVGGVASGNTSIAMAGGIAGGLDSWAWYPGSEALAKGSVAFGGGVANGDFGFAVGTGSIAGTNAIAMGGNAIACTQGALSFGYNTIAYAVGSVAVGVNSHAHGTYSFAFGKGIAGGREIQASGLSSINFSTNTSAQIVDHGASADYSIILGGINHLITSPNTGAAIIGSCGTTGIKLSGATSYVDNVVVANLAIWSAPSDDNDGDVLVWDSATMKVGKSNVAALGALSGTTNGLQTIDQEAGLGGTLTEATTTILGDTKSLTIGTSGSKLNTLTEWAATKLSDTSTMTCIRASAGDIGIDAQNNSQVFIKSQSGTVANDTFTNAIALNMDYSNGIFNVIDNRAGVEQTGLEYQTDYSGNYTDRSLVDKAYVDSVAAGLDAKDAAFVATTTSDGNIDLTGGTFFSGSTIDGIVVNDGWRVLIKNQTDAVENGVYDYSASTSGFTRSDDFDGAPSGEVSNGAFLSVVTGDTLINTQWIVTTPDPIIVDTTEITFSLLSQQLDIVAGTGITITTSGAQREVSTKLAGTSSLSYDGGLGLRVDSSIAGTGLTMTSGVLDVCASTIPSTGSEILVRFGASCNLVVDQDDFSYTTASNGLTKVGTNVTLGGDLTGDTTINGTGSYYDMIFDNLGDFNVTVNQGSVITDNSTTGGIRYFTDYSGDFVARSLVDASYVTGLTSANAADIAYITGNTINGATNGLTKTGTNAELGGSLTKPTSINIAGHSLTISAKPIQYGSDYSVQYTPLSIPDVGYVTGLTAGLTADLTYISGVTDGQTDDINYISGVTTANTNDITYLGSISGLTANAITGVTNGLTKVGSNDAKLGGALTETTTITGAQTYDLFLGGEGGDELNQLIGLTTGGVVLTHEADTSALRKLALEQDRIELDITKTGAVCKNILMPTGATGILITDSIDTCGLKYAADYSANATARWIPDAAWVTGQTGAIDAQNGLTRNGNFIELGGTLTGDTIVDTSGNGIVFGNSSTATGSNSFAIGNGSIVTGQDSFAGGFGACAYGYVSFAFGCGARATGDYGIAMGHYACATESDGVALGWNAEARAQHAVALGELQTIYSSNSTSIGGSCNSISGGSNCSGIFAGNNNIIESGNTNAVIIGGTGITATADVYPAHTIVQNLAIFSIPTTGADTDGVLVWDDADNKVKQVAASVIGGVTGANNGLTVDANKTVVLGGTLTGNTTLNVSTFDMIFSDDSVQYAADYSGTYVPRSLTDAGYVTGLTSGLQSQITTNANNITANDNDISYISGVTTANTNDITYLGVFSGDTVNDLAYISGQTDINTDDIAYLGSVSGVTTANNGLTAVGKNIVLGGTLTGDTQINTATFGVVFGQGTATGDDSVSIGASACADGNDSLAVGVNARAIGSPSFAAGSTAQARGIASGAIGVNVIACDVASFAIGCGAQAIGYFSFAGGKSTCAWECGSVSMGGASQACGKAAMALGCQATAVGNYSFAANHLTTATGARSLASGWITEAVGTASNAQGSRTCAVANYTHTGGYGTTTSKDVCAGGLVAFNHSQNNASQTAGFGANAANSAILGGLNHNIATGNVRAAIIGGNTISLTGSSYADFVIVDNLGIWTAPASGDAQNDGILVYNTADKKVKQVAASSLGEDNNVYAVTGITSATLTTSEYVVIVDTSGAAQTVTLPSAPVTGQAYKIKDSGNALANNVTIAGNGNNIDSGTSAAINTDYGALEIVFDGTEWWTLAFIN